MPPPTAGLWRNPDFLKLWTGQTISELGSLVTSQALPLTALLALNASAVEMGVLAAVGMVPVLLVGLPAGVWVDRVRRRPLLIGADIGRALLLATIPVAALLRILSMEQLYVMAFLVGVLTVLFNVGYQSHLPALVEREHIVEGNSKLGMSSSVAESVGPALGGTLVQIITAPMTILVDAVSFIFSALFLSRIRKPEPPPSPRSEEQNVWRDVGEGMRTLLRHPVLRAIVGSEITHRFFGSFFATIYSLFVIRELGLGPAALGVLVSAGGVGALLGAMLTSTLTRRFGLGSTLTGALVMATSIQIFLPLAGGPALLAFSMLFVLQLVGDIAWAVYQINEVSLRQSITPDRLLGRTNASMHFLTGGVATAGMLVGGALGELIGLRATVVVAVLGLLLSVPWLLFSPVRSVREQPEAVG